RRRAAGRGGVRHAAGGEGPHRAVAGAVQHRPATQQPRLPPARPGGGGAVDAGPRSFAPRPGVYGRPSRGTNIVGGFNAGGRSRSRTFSRAALSSGAPARNQMAQRALTARSRTTGSGSRRRRATTSLLAKLPTSPRASTAARRGFVPPDW